MLDVLDVETADTASEEVLASTSDDRTPSIVEVGNSEVVVLELLLVTRLLLGKPTGLSLDVLVDRIVRTGCTLVRKLLDD